ncbi:MAG: head GIN domain-containing protein, partial [Anaerolineales bacterium]
KVVLEDVGKLYLTQGASVGLEVEADEDVIQLISTEVRNGKLRLRIKEPWMDRLARFFVDTWRGSHIVYRLNVIDLEHLALYGAAKVISDALHVDSLDLVLSGAGEVMMDDLQATHFQLMLSGAGKVEAAGKVEQQRIRITGAGKFAGEKLHSQACDVSLSGTGKAVVWSQKELDLNISGVGKVSFFGNPKVSQRITGIGKVERLGEAPA